MVCLIIGALHHCCAAALVCDVTFVIYIFIAIFPPLVCYALASLVCIIVGALQLVNHILVAIFFWCNVSSVHCIFGVMYICTFGILCIGNFGGASLV